MVQITVSNGYEVESVEVDNMAICDGNSGTTSTAAEPGDFENTLLTNVTVSVDPQVTGGTASTISCVDKDGNAAGSASTGANGDGSLTRNNLLPTAPNATLVCTITVDP